MKTLNQVLDSIDSRIDEAYLSNRWDEAEIYSKAMELGFQSRDLDEYSEKIEKYMIDHRLEYTSDQGEIWETILMLTYNETEL